MFVQLFCQIWSFSFKSFSDLGDKRNIKHISRTPRTLGVGTTYTLPHTPDKSRSALRLMDARLDLKYILYVLLIRCIQNHHSLNMLSEYLKKANNMPNSMNRELYEHVSCCETCRNVDTLR